jgi:hypothetical protein
LFCGFGLCEAPPFGLECDLFSQCHAIQHERSSLGVQYPGGHGVIATAWGACVVVGIAGLALLAFVFGAALFARDEFNRTEQDEEIPGHHR